MTGPESQNQTASGEATGSFARYTRERIEYWEAFAARFERWQRTRGYYLKRLAEVYSFLIPPGMKVLEIGCGNGDLLAAVKPSHGTGVDFSPSMLRWARERHPEFTFIEADAHSFGLGETFEYIILSDLLNDLMDVQTTLERVARHCTPETRVLINIHSNLWQLPRRWAEWTGLAKRQLQQNWLTPGDLTNLLYLSGFEVIRISPEVLSPFWIPLLSRFANRYLVKIWPFRWMGLSNVFVARPLKREARPDVRVTVVVAARNEEGNVPNIFNRVPQMGRGTELIFVEGNSSDDTFGAIEREIQRRPEMDVKLFKQPGKGKGDAVRTGFAAATGDLLMILDADLTVPPEDLPRFYEAWCSGRADFVNGVRLVYPMEQHAMRFFNQIGNKFFSLAFSWLLSQSIKDTLCGTKVLSRRDYEMIAANRAYFGEIDPFGDFDLIFGAAKYNLKIVDMPIRYRERTYGDTNIQRWRHGVILLRMVVKAMRKIKFV